MERILSILKGFKDIFWFVVVLVLLIVIQFKNGAIKSLREEVSAKPTVEYIYKDSIQVIRDTIPEPYKVTEWKDRIIIETDSVPMDLTSADSAQIASAYIDVFKKYNEIKFYNDTLKNDTTAFISLYEEVTKNSIYTRELTFVDKTPVIRITNTITKPDKTLSFVGGIGANIGKDANSLSLGVGVVAPSNRVYLFQYDPVNKGFGGAVYLPIFNIRK